MLKKCLKVLFLLLAGYAFLVKANMSSITKNLVDITARLSEQELQVIENSDKVVYLTPDLIHALNNIDIKEDSALKDLKELVSLGYIVAPYNEALEALNHAITVCPDAQSYQALSSYKHLLENNDATVVVEEIADKRSKTKAFRKICVSSLVAKNIAVQCFAGQTGTFNNLAVNNGVINTLNVCAINGATCAVDPKLCNPNGPAINFNGPLHTCGNIVFNDVPTSNALNVIGNPFINNIATLREVIGFSGSNVNVVIDGTPSFGSQITVTGLPTATIISGEGVDLSVPAQVTALTPVNVSLINSTNIDSSAIGNITFQLPVTFPTKPFNLYHDIPSVEITYSVNNPTALVVNNNPTNVTSITNITVSATNITQTGMTLNITIVPLGGGDYTDKATLQGVLKTLIDNLFNDNLRLNLWVAGHDI